MNDIRRRIIGRKIGGLKNKLHETQEVILRCINRGIDAADLDGANEMELEQIERLEKLEQERDAI